MTYDTDVIERGWWLCDRCGKCTCACCEDDCQCSTKDDALGDLMAQAETAHNVTAQPVEKLRSGIIGYRFVCSCGRVGNGHHRTPEKAIERGHDHVPGAGEGGS